VQRYRLDRPALGSLEPRDAKLQRDISRDDVRLALVHAGVCDVYTLREYVCRLHCRIDQLGKVHTLSLAAAQDVDRPLHPCERCVLADVDDRRPVVVVLVVEVTGENDLERCRVSTDAEQRCAHRLGEIAGRDATDQRSVASELVVDPCVPIGQEDAAAHAGCHEIAHLGHAQQPGTEMRLPRDLEADVVLQRRPGFEEWPQLVASEDLGCVALDQRYALAGVHRSR